MPRAAPDDRSCEAAPQVVQGVWEAEGPPPERGVKCSPVPTCRPSSPGGALIPARTTIAFIHADVEVAAKGGGIDDAVGDLVVGRGVFIRCLEGR